MILSILYAHQKGYGVFVVYLINATAKLCQVRFPLTHNILNDVEEELFNDVGCEFDAQPPRKCRKVVGEDSQHLRAADLEHGETFLQEFVVGILQRVAFYSESEATGNVARESAGEV